MTASRRIFRFINIGLAVGHMFALMLPTAMRGMQPKRSNPLRLSLESKHHFIYDFSVVDVKKGSVHVKRAIKCFLKDINDSYVATPAIWAEPGSGALRAVVHCQTPEAQSVTQWKWNSSMPTNLKIVPRLLSFAAAAFVLLAVNADAQQPATRSVIIPPIPRGQARIWVYRGSQPSDPLDMYRLEGVTVNGAKIGFMPLGGALYRDVAPGHYVIAGPSFQEIDPSQAAEVDLAAGQDVYLRLEALGWPNAGDNYADNFYVRVMPPQTARTAIAQLAFLSGN
jgi:hypothetical protein